MSEQEPLEREALLSMRPGEREQYLNAGEPEVQERDGRRYRKVYSGYTIQEYFSHETPEAGPGPGWDARFTRLPQFGLDPFSEPDSWPRDWHYVWREMDEPTPETPV